MVQAALAGAHLGPSAYWGCCWGQLSLGLVCTSAAGRAGGIFGSVEAM